MFRPTHRTRTGEDTHGRQRGTYSSQRNINTKDASKILEVLLFQTSQLKSKRVSTSQYERVLKVKYYLEIVERLKQTSFQESQLSLGKSKRV